MQALRRDVILSPAGDGGWEVAELVRLRNPGSRTLVPDRERPVVGISLPPGATAFEAGEGDQQGADSARAGELVKVGSRAWVQPPFVPGERDFVFRYRLPAKPQRVVIPVDRSTDSISVFLRQPAPDAEVQGLAEVEAFTAEGERFRRFSGAGLRPGASVVLDWRGPLPAPIDPRWTAVLVAAVILAAGGWLASRRRG